MKVKIDRKEAVLEKGDMVIAKEGQIHTMTNISDQDVDYFAMGVVIGKGGKTINLR